MSSNIERVEFITNQIKNRNTKRLKLGKNVLIPAESILTEAPKKIEFNTPHYDLIIPIGKDHTALLIIDEAALLELHKLNPEIAIF